MMAVQPSLDAAVAGSEVETWITRADDRGVAIVRDGSARRLVSVLGGTAASDDPVRIDRAPWDLPLVAIRDVAGVGTVVVEDLPVGGPSTRLGATGSVPGFALEVAASVGATHAEGQLVGPLHPALVFVTDDGGLAGVSQRILRSAVRAPDEGRVALFGSLYPSPSELRGEAGTAADDVFRLAALVWRWRHGRAPFGSEAAEIDGVLAGRPVDPPSDELDASLVAAFAPDAATRPTAVELAAAIRRQRVR